MNAVGDRDFILESMQWASMLMIHISRWSEDLILYSSAEFGFVRLSDGKRVASYEVLVCCKTSLADTSSLFHWLLINAAEEELRFP